MFKNITILILFLANTLFAAPELKMFERFSKADGGPDTRGAIWYDEKHNNIFVADHGKGLWKIDECSNIHGQTTNKDNGLWDIRYDGGYIFAVGKSGLIIYNENGDYLNSLNGIQGEGIYVKNGYAYIVGGKGSSSGGITIVNVQDIDNPSIVGSTMTGGQFSQIRGDEHYLYVSSLDGKLYLFKINGSTLTYKDDITIFPSSEARKIFVGKKEQVYINSNFGELAIVKVDTSNSKLSLKGTWQSSESHGGGQQSPAAGGVFVTEIKEKLNSKVYALITAADGNQDGYLYWLDVTDPTNIKKVDALHDTEENYGFNDVWVNDTKIYLAAHNGFSFMKMDSMRNIPVISIKDSDGSYKEDINVTKNADNINETKIFYAKISNKDAANKLDLKLKAPKGDSNWDYHYYLLSTNEEITNKITNHGYEKEKLDPGDDIKIKIEITPISKNATDTTVTIIASNKNSKEVCGKAIESDEVSAKVTFKSETNAFTCSSNSYIFTSTNKDKPTDSYTVDILTGSSSLEKSHFHTTNINAIGYNVKDNYIWGYDRINKKVARVDANYNVTSFDIKNLPAKSFISGDVSLDGVLYLYEKKDSKIYRVDVDPASSNYLKKLDDLDITKKIETSDMAFNPIDNKIYLMGNNDRKLYSIDPTNGNVRDLGSTKMPGSKSSGANYFDKDGNFYIYNNSGKIYKIDISDPDNIDPKAVFLSDAPEFESKDGARCPNAAIDTPPPANSECSLSFPGAVSSTNDEIQINVNTKIYGTTNHTLITKTLAIGKLVQCDDAPCKKSNTLAKKMDFDLLLGNGSDGDKILSNNKTLTISSDKEYKKFQTGQHNTITINGDITIKSQSDFYINANSEININGNVVIYADKFDSNQQGIFNINGSLKIIANIFYLNSGNKIQNIPNPEDFVVLAKDIIDINSQVDFKGLFYSAGDIQINNDTKISGALTGNYIDINNKVVINYDSGAVNTYCGSIEANKTTPSQFNVWDKGGLISNQVITTKIVGEDINLTLASLNEDGTDYEELTKNVKVALVSPEEQLTDWLDINLVKEKFKDFTITPNDLHKNKNRAFKEVRVFIKYKDSNGTTQISISSDGFAIRPDRFTLSVPSSKKAAESFNLNATVASLNNEIVNSYNEQINTSFNIKYKEIKPACDIADIDFSGAGFVNGSLTKNIKYAEVGVLDFNISEIPGHEFAIIDKDDTSDARRYITEANSSTIELQSAGFEVTKWALDGGSNHFKYFADMSDIEQMGAQLDVTLKAVNLDGTVTKNYRDKCYVKDTNLTIIFDMNGTNGAVNRVNWKDIVHADHNSDGVPAIDVVSPSSNNSFDYDVVSSSFKNGESNESLMINFGREQTQTKDPIKFTLKEVNVINSDSATGYLTQTDQYVDFYYGRLHVPTYYGSTNNADVKVFHEVYCKSCDKTNFTYANGAESADNIYWYILKKPYYDDSVSRFEGVQGKNNDFGYASEDPYLEQDRNKGNVINVGALSVITNSLDLITFQIPKLPFNDRIEYKPSHWLIYNRFNDTIDKHSFNINISSATESWAGKGKKGLSLTDDASLRSYKKMDW